MDRDGHGAKTTINCCRQHDGAQGLSHDDLLARHRQLLFSVTFAWTRTLRCRRKSDPDRNVSLPSLQLITLGCMTYLARVTSMWRLSCPNRDILQGRDEQHSAGMASVLAFTAKCSTGSPADLIPMGKALESTNRYGHPDGTCLLLGAQRKQVSATAELYDSVHWPFSEAGSLTTCRSFATATLLDGSVPGDRRYHHRDPRRGALEPPSSESMQMARQPTCRTGRILLH